MTSPEIDVAVIGAGVAGLAAARELGRSGLSVALIDARERLGGRILSIHPPGWPQPIELGAEFIHGGNNELSAILHEAGLGTTLVPEKHWYLRDGHLVPADDIWDRLEHVFQQIGSDVRRRHLSFAEFLTGLPLSTEDRTLATTYVEGFEAAPAEEMSTIALHEAMEGGPEEQSRLIGGYGRLVAALHDSLVPDRTRILLGRTVTRVSWREGAVEIHARPYGPGTQQESLLLSARAAVLTLPAGVLRAEPPETGAVRFEPSLPEKEALWRQLPVGHATRLVLRFTENFWSDSVVPAALRVRDERGFGFLHSDDPAFPVWWSLGAEPVLVAWVGGPRAIRIESLGREEALAQALATLARLFQTTPERLRSLVKDWQRHDWGADPFARGAYSYAAAGREDLPAQLRSPISNTLFFAGEATADSTSLGTVHGALSSGLRAAREVLAALTASTPHAKNPAPR